MAEIERLTITLPAEMAALVRGAADEGNYASSSEVIREALGDWKTKCALQLQLQELEGLKADIDQGLADLAKGRMQEFDTAWIIERGRTLLAGRSPSRLTEAAEPDLAEIWATLASEASEEIATRSSPGLSAASNRCGIIRMLGPAREQL